MTVVPARDDHSDVAGGHSVTTAVVWLDTATVLGRPDDERAVDRETSDAIELEEDGRVFEMVGG